MKRKIIIVVLILCILLFIGWIIFTNSTYYKIKTLYSNPIKVNQVYDDYVYDEYKNYVTILSYDGEEKEVSIPEKINNKPVYSIDDSAFYANSNLEKVIIPKYVIRIGHQTFIGNANLREVVLPDGLVDIGGWSFDGCPKLEKIYVKKDTKTDKLLKELSFAKFIVYK